MGKPSPLSRRSGGNAGGWGRRVRDRTVLAYCHIPAGSETVASDHGGRASLDDRLQSNHQDKHQASQSPRVHPTEALLSINLRRFFRPIIIFYTIISDFLLFLLVNMF